MKTAALRSPALFDEGRLDARYFTAPAVRIRQALAHSSELVLRRIGDYAEVRAPARFKRAYAAQGEAYVPYLRPYDVFEYLPPEADRLSVVRTERLDEYQIKAGDLLQTCSGRNLGPLTIADVYLAQFALSHDMVRITIENETERFYTLAFLQSPTGQALLRGDLNGSVIDHISTGQVSSIQVPFVPEVQTHVAQMMKQAVELRESSRIVLRGAVASINEAFPNAQRRPNKLGWAVNAASLGTRLDAAFHSRHVADVKALLRQSGGVELGEVAEVVKPGGRPKLYYVGPGQGTPFLSGTQILQLDVVGGKNIAPRSIDVDSGYGLGTGWITFQADGRAEESLGYPSVVTEERAGWFASGHVGRAKPRDASDTGWIWASMASDVVQEQFAALACGSVVDALYVDGLERVVLPPRAMVESERAQDAWDGLSDSAGKADNAIGTVENALSGLGV